MFENGAVDALVLKQEYIPPAFKANYLEAAREEKVGNFRQGRKRLRAAFETDVNSDVIDLGKKPLGTLKDFRLGSLSLQFEQAVPGGVRRECVIETLARDLYLPSRSLNR
jgi:hypothetical protein